MVVVVVSGVLVAGTAVVETTVDAVAVVDFVEAAAGATTEFVVFATVVEGDAVTAVVDGATDVVVEVVVDEVVVVYEGAPPDDESVHST